MSFYLSETCALISCETRATYITNTVYIFMFISRTIAFALPVCLPKPVFDFFQALTTMHMNVESRNVKVTSLGECKDFLKICFFVYSLIICLVLFVSFINCVSFSHLPFVFQIYLYVPLLSDNKTRLLQLGCAILCWKILLFQIHDSIWSLWRIRGCSDKLPKIVMPKFYFSIKDFMTKRNFKVTILITIFGEDFILKCKNTATISPLSVQLHIIISLTLIQKTSFPKAAILFCDSIKSCKELWDLKCSYSLKYVSWHLNNWASANIWGSGVKSGSASCCVICAYAN